MLTELKQLTQDCDGRYARDGELQFLQDYLDTIESRITTYEKIQTLENTLIQETEGKVKEENPTAFHKGEKDVSAICERDRKHTMRFLATAMLFSDQDKLRNTLLWQRIIMGAFNDNYPSKITYQMMEEVMKKEFTREEMELLNPSLQLVQTLLS
ncbi:allophycocyanin [Cyanothece sp. BG0011]|uniref:allophycocyanin n=1 Tax=Cyanothece sp. BG0011 TaxID=2082950 RepID=UPI000D1F577B|nr:allophycocyanin [Cyanothece sp. BG0011]